MLAFRQIEDPKPGDLATIECQHSGVRFPVPVVVKHVGPLRIIVETWSCPTQISLKHNEVRVSDDEMSHNLKA